MSVAKILIEKDKLFTMSGANTVFNAVTGMDERNLGVALITDESNKIVGVFSERDLMRRIVAVGKDPQTTKLKDVMTSPLVTIPVGTLPSAALEVLQKFKIRHLPVRADDSEEIIGIVSIKDLLSYMVTVVTTLNKKLKTELDQYSFL